MKKIIRAGSIGAAVIIQLSGLAHAALLWPVPSNRRISATHGEFRSSVSNRIHRGADVASSGEDVLSISAGVITEINRSAGLIEIDGFFRYRHMRSIPTRFEKNVQIPQGEFLGESSDAGAEGHPHLHFATGDQNPLLITEFNVPDSSFGSIITFHIREPGRSDRELRDGDIFNAEIQSPEFIINAFDKTDNGNPVAFYRIKTTLDGNFLKEHTMIFVSGNDTTFSVPPASDIYAFGGDAAKFVQTTRSSYFYRMGIKNNISEGPHQICIEGFDLDRGVEELSAGPTCVNITEVLQLVSPRMLVKQAIKVCSPSGKLLGIQSVKTKSSEPTPPGRTPFF